MNSLEQIKASVLTKAVRIVAITAPPRTASTALERALIESPDVAGQCNEPWSLTDTSTIAERRDLAYRKLLTRIQHLQREAGADAITLVVKNIADFIAPGDYFAEWLDLTEDHIFLVRHPVLAAESELNIFFRDIAANEPLFSGVTPHDYARQNGFKNWLALHAFAKETRDYRLYEVPIVTYLHNADPTHCDPSLNAAIDTFRPHVNHEERFRFRIFGWEAFAEHLHLARKRNASYIVADAADLRATPQAFLFGMCKKLSLPFAPAMIEWPESKSISFDKGWESHPDHFFYQRVMTSCGILPQDEPPLPMEKFPPSLQDFISRPGGALDIYSDALRDLHFYRPEENR